MGAKTVLFILIHIMKIKGTRGYRFIKEIGGAFRRRSLSKAAQVLSESNLISGRVLDYGCGFGYDAKHFDWESYDPHYQQKLPDGEFDTIICNCVINTLTRPSRTKALNSIQSLLSENGKAYISVPRNTPRAGKIAPYKRILNYVSLTLPSVYLDKKCEIYVLDKSSEFKDKTKDVV